MPTCKAHSAAQKKQTKGESSTGCPKGVLGPRADAPVSIRSDTTREKGSGPVPFLNPSVGARAKLKHRHEAFGTQPALRAEGPGPG